MSGMARPSFLPVRSPRGRGRRSPACRVAGAIPTALENTGAIRDRPADAPFPLPSTSLPSNATDEVSAIVVDMGTHTVKAGYAGEDPPKAVFPTAVGWISKDRLGDVEMKEAKSDKRSKSRGKKAVKENEEEEEDAEEEAGE